MLEVLISLFLGGAVGRLGSNSPRLKSSAGRLSSLGVIVLLFCMGMGIGANPKVMSDLPLLGGQALLLAIAGAGGALVMSLPLIWIMRQNPKP